MLFSKTMMFVAFIALQQLVESTTDLIEVKRAIEKIYPIIRENPFSLYGPLRSNDDDEEVFYAAIYNENYNKACRFNISRCAQNITAEKGTCFDINETNARTLEGYEYCRNIFVCPEKGNNHYYGLCGKFLSADTVKELPAFLGAEQTGGSEFLSTRKRGMTESEHSLGYDLINFEDLPMISVSFGKVRHFEYSAELYVYPALLLTHQIQPVECNIELFVYTGMTHTILNFVCANHTRCGVKLEIPVEYRTYRWPSRSGVIKNEKNRSGQNWCELGTNAASINKSALLFLISLILRVLVRII